MSAPIIIVDKRRTLEDDGWVVLFQNGAPDPNEHVTQWVFGDGTTPSGEFGEDPGFYGDEVQHFYPDDGTYTVTMTVSTDPNNPTTEYVTVGNP